jgi:orotidine-5'-phosphate decarboxylase
MINLENIIRDIKKKNKTQKVFDSMEEPSYFNILKKEVNNKELLDSLNIGIQIFEATEEYNSFAKIYIRNNLFYEIINKMKKENKNPIIFDAFKEEDVPYINFLKKQPQKVLFEKKLFYIDVLPGGGFGMGETGTEIKVFLLGNIQ